VEGTGCFHVRAGKRPRGTLNETLQQEELDTAVKPGILDILGLVKNCCTAEQGLSLAEHLDQTLH
jgi:hypothetical protein